MSSTRMSRHVNAPRPKVYAALLDPTAIARWKVPDGMTSRIHAFDAREGGSFRISLTYVSETGKGKAASTPTRIMGASRSSCPTSASSKSMNSRRTIRRCKAK